MVYLGIVGLLNVILVHFDLHLMLVAHLHQRLRQLAFKILLVAIVQLHHTRLMTPFCLPQFLLENYQNHQLQMHVCFFQITGSCWSDKRGEKRCGESESSFLKVIH